MTRPAKNERMNVSNKPFTGGLIMRDYKEAKKAMWHNGGIHHIQSNYSEEDLRFIKDNLSFCTGDILSIIKNKMRYNTGAIYCGGMDGHYAYPLGGFVFDVAFDLHANERGIKGVYGELERRHKLLLETNGMSEEDFLCLALYSNALSYIEKARVENDVLFLDVTSSPYHFATLCVGLLHYLRTGRHYPAKVNGLRETRELLDTIADKAQFSLGGFNFELIGMDTISIGGLTPEHMERLRQLFAWLEGLVNYFGHYFTKKIEL